MVWYSNKAVGAVSTAAESRIEEIQKGLTARLKCGNLNKLPLKESERQLKLPKRKYLTRASESDKIKKLLRMQNGPRVENF